MIKVFMVTFFIALINIKNIAAGVRKQPKITIVGAGLSGLSAAVRLLENGYENIVIIEAENRIGGRIHSVKMNDLGYVDLGAQWVHGQGNNSVYELSSDSYEFGATGFDGYFPLFLQSDGAFLDQNKCQKYAKSASDILFSSYETMSKYPGSIENFFIREFKKQATKESGNDELIGEFIDFYEKEMNIWNGSTTWSDLSAPLHCISGYNSGTLHMTWKRDGFQKFIEILLGNKEILSKIKFSKEVANIQWNPYYENKMPIITTTDGNKYFTDHIIFTASLGVLKDRYRSLFSPQLPKGLINAIQVMGFGNIGKVFLEFKDSFWPSDDPNWVAYGLLWTKSDKKMLKGTKREWLLNIQEIAKVDAFPNVLEALLAGPDMKYFETLSDEQIVGDCMWLLEKFLQKPLQRPISMKRTKWLTNRNFLGSYSYYSVDAAIFKVTSKDLAQTLYSLSMKPEIIFAGEHTDDLFSSNAHGAVNSGFRAAEKLLKYYT